MVMGSLKEETEVVVVGAGPGGYVAAIRAADLGKEVVLVEEREQLGGVCLIEGCIPSKALINAVEVAHNARLAERFGLSFGEVRIELDKLRAFTKGVVDNLTGGVAGLLKRRGVTVVRGRARFDGPSSLRIEAPTGSEKNPDVGGISFRQCILATGSCINKLPAAYDQPVWHSAEALTLPCVPERLLVVGGGYIGLEMGLVYAGLGSRVTMVEFFPRLLMGADEDLVDVMVRSATPRFEAVLVDTKVTGVQKTSAGFAVSLESADGKEETREYDQVLVAVGRRPNTDDLGLETIGLEVDEQRLIPVDERQRTRAPHIYAIGDIVRGPQLAHKASREAKVAAEVIAQEQAAFDNRAIPAVVFTDPEIAWAGLTEREARDQGIEVKIGRFPLHALGRAQTLGRTDGLIKVIADPQTHLVRGVGMVGVHVSELISEATLAIEMGATLEDLMVTIHPHPTISEAIMEAAEVAAGHPVHLNPPKRRG
jgi:dihydrolipoamide dehydrogenase